jgi:hypothetical protein
MVSMSSAVAAVRLSGRMCWKESLSGIGEAVFGEEVGLDHLCPEAPSHGILNDPQIGFAEDFRRLRQSLPNTRLRTPQNWVLRRFQVVASKTARCHATYGHVASRKFSPLAAGDGGNREGPAKKAPCGWLGHAHRAEDKTVERRLRGSQSSMAAGWGEQRQCVHDMTTLSSMSVLRRSRPASGSNRIATLPSCGEGSRPWKAGSPGASLV